MNDRVLTAPPLSPALKRESRFSAVSSVNGIAFGSPVLPDESAMRHTSPGANGAPGIRLENGCSILDCR